MAVRVSLNKFFLSLPLIASCLQLYNWRLSAVLFLLSTEVSGDKLAISSAFATAFKVFSKAANSACVWASAWEAVSAFTPASDCFLLRSFNLVFNVSKIVLILSVIAYHCESAFRLLSSATPLAAILPNNFAASPAS